jgi:acyl carrier protein
MSTADTVRRVLDTHAKLRVPASSLPDAADLYAAGMTSHASVNVMLAVEDAFDIEFPDELLTKTTFCSIGAISTAVETLREAAA